MTEAKEKDLEKENLRIKFINFCRIDIVQELFYAGIGNLAFLIAFLFFPSFFWKEPYLNIIIAIIVLSFFIIFLIFNQPNSKTRIFRVDYKRNIILFTVFNLAILNFLFFRTEFGLNGIHQDNFYRSAFITQMAYSGVPQDFAFKGYSAFMAPLYWYLLALVAKVFQIKPYKMIKIGFLFSYYVLIILSYEVWKKIFNQKTCFYITIIFFSIIANYIEIIYWIDHLISCIFLIPYFIYYFENYKNREFTRKDYALAGLFGSILVCTFYLYFVLIPIYLGISFVQNKITDEIEVFKEKFKRILYITFFILIFSSWFWIPLIINVLLIGFESHQNNFFPSYALDMPFEAYLKFNLLSIILIIGVIFIIMRYNKSKIFTILGNIVLSVYILYLLGYIGLLIGFPLVHFRVLVVSHYVLVISFILFYIEFFRVLKAQDIIKNLKQKINIQTVEIFLLIIFIFSQNYRNAVELYESDYYKRSLNQEIPEEVDIFLELDYENKVFLTQYYEVAAFLPIYMFIVYNSHYSHPSALNNERIIFLKQLSECESSKEFYKKLIGSKYGPIDYFILEPCDDNATEYLFDTGEIENFPYRSDVKIYFKAELFEDSSYFERHKIKGEIIYKTIY